MQDRPTYDELLAAVERFLDDEVVVKGEGAQRYQGRVAANVIRLVRRELQLEEESLEREWVGLDKLLGAAGRPQSRHRLRDALTTRNEELSMRIRSGAADTESFRDAALSQVRQTVRDKMMVSNPKWVGESGST